MKKTVFVTVLSATLLLTGCSSGKKTETSAATDSTTTAVETTTAATTAVTTTTVETTAEPDKPEDYADIVHFNIDKSETAVATDFNFVDAELYKDDNGVLKYPNYPAGKDIVIQFKSDKTLKYGAITQFPKGNSNKSNKLAYADESTKDSKNGILKMLTCTDGVYTLTISAKYATNDCDFCIQLYTIYPLMKNEEVRGYGIVFYVRCYKETVVPVPEFTPVIHSRMNNNVGAKDFDFGDAECEFTHDKHEYTLKLPKYKVNTDIRITFKCDKELALSRITAIDNNREFSDITDPGYLKSDNGTYTLTIPAEQAKAGRNFDIFIKETGKNAKTLWFMIAC